MTAEIRDRIRVDLAAARAAHRAGDPDRCWAPLEHSHVLSQPWASWHVRVHGAMLATGLRQRDDLADLLQRAGR